MEREKKQGEREAVPFHEALKAALFVMGMVIWLPLNALGFVGVTAFLLWRAFGVE